MFESQSFYELHEIYTKNLNSLQSYCVDNKIIQFHCKKLKMKKESFWSFFWPWKYLEYWFANILKFQVLFLPFLDEKCGVILSTFGQQ